MSVTEAVPHKQKRSSQEACEADDSPLISFRASDREPTIALDKHDVLLETGSGTPLAGSG